MRSPLFTKMPSEHYMTISKMIFEICTQDVADADQVKVLIKVLVEKKAYQSAVASFS